MKNQKLSVEFYKYSIPEDKKKIIENICPKVDAVIEKWIKLNHPELIKDKDYLWCLAGGFASFVAGRTMDFGDIDVFLIGRHTIPFKYSLKLKLVEDYNFDIIARSFYEQKSVSNDYLIARLLLSFDMDICRYAIIENGTYLVYLDHKNNDTVAEYKKERLIKYKHRSSNNFSQKDLQQLNMEFFSIPETSEIDYKTDDDKLFSNDELNMEQILSNI